MLRNNVSALLIDTHAHLDDEKFENDLSEVLERTSNLKQVITIATTAESSLTSVELAAKYPHILSATVGIQPNNVAEAQEGDWDKVLSLVDRERVVGLGETGLDRYWDFTPFDQQEDYFARHLELAREKNLPVVIHCREAEADVVRMLREDFDRHGPVRGVMHSFTGALETMQSCVEMGLYISFAGMLTFKNAKDLREVAAHVPLDRALVETDSPYLAPVPNRGKRNEPAFVEHTARCLAEVLSVSEEQFFEQTTKNACALFRL